jgi:hypothetical protein
MTRVGRLVRLGVWLAAAGGWLAGQAMGQSVWLTGQIGPVTLTNVNSPPAMVFDSQDCPRLVCDTGAALQYTAGDAAGVIPNWSAWVGTGVSNANGPGQVYLARSGSQMYAGFRPLKSPPETTVRAAVFDGTSWQLYTPSWVLPATIYGSYPNLFGLIVDGGGQPQWLIHNEKPVFVYGPKGTDYSQPLWGYYLLNHAAGGDPAAVAVALGTGGGYFRAGATGERALYQGGHALLDRFGNLHTVQYCPRGGGSLMYAKGPLAGPFQVFDNLEAGYGVKMGRPSVTVDAMGLPHVAYAEQWPGFGLKHLAWTGSAWASEWIEQGGSVYGPLGTFPKILVDRIGALHVVYADVLRGQLRHAAKTQGQWQVETVDTVGMQVNNSAVGMLAAAVDSQGGIGVVYWDATNCLYKYAYRLPLDQGFVPLSRQPAVEVTNQ